MYLVTGLNQKYKLRRSADYKEN